MKFTAQQIAELVNGTLLGDKNIEVNSFSKIEDANTYSLSFLANSKYESFIYTTTDFRLKSTKTVQLVFCLRAASKPSCKRAVSKYVWFGDVAITSSNTFVCATEKLLTNKSVINNLKLNL